MSNKIEERCFRGSVRCGLLLVVLFAALTGSGCAQMGIQQQRLVSKPNMIFDSSGAFRYDSTLLAQVEIGAAISGGAQAAGCTACR